MQRYSSLKHSDERIVEEAPFLPNRCKLNITYVSPNSNRGQAAPTLVGMLSLVRSINCDVLLQRVILVITSTCSSSSIFLNL